MAKKHKSFQMTDERMGHIPQKYVYRFFLAITIGLMAFGLVNFLHTQYFYANAIEAEGRLNGLSSSPGFSRVEKRLEYIEVFFNDPIAFIQGFTSRTAYSPTIVYNHPELGDISFTSSAATTYRKDRYPEDFIFKVYYLESDPRHPRLKSNFDIWGGSALVFAVGVLGFLKVRSKIDTQ